MYKDPTEFRKRFAKWKAGEKPYKNGQISDEEYIATMEKIAASNWQQWGDDSEDAALTRILNDNTYNYRGYYNDNPKGAANADTHWPDEYKTVWHPTFSNLSKYSGKKSLYNPYGYPGGTWQGEFFNPQWYQQNPHSRGFYKDGYPRLPRFFMGTEGGEGGGDPVIAAKNAINFANIYYNSEGFKQRFKNLNKATKGFLYSGYNPAASYWPETDEWDPHPKHSWSVLKTPINFRKAVPLSSPEPNAYYNPYTGNIHYGDERTLQIGYSKNWDEIMSHEAGHALDHAIKPRNTRLLEELDGYNQGYGYTYSNMYPIFRKSKSYLKVRNIMYSMGELDGKLYDKDPSYGHYMITDKDLFHDAMPSESYADLFLLRKMLYDQNIFDSTKTGVKFTKEHFDKFKKNNHIRLLDNFSDDLIIWMINNVAQNNSVKLKNPNINLG